MLVIWALVGVPAAALPASGVSSDHGTFNISIAGESIGTEKFEIRSTQNTIVTKAEVQLRAKSGGKTFVFKTFPELTLDFQLRPVSYTWVQNRPRDSRLHIDFSTSPVKVEYHTVDGKNDYREFWLAPNVIILDDNVVYQYELLVSLYDRTSRGSQVFQAFIPQEALPGQVTVADAGHEQIAVGGKSESLRHLTVTTQLAHIDLWVDGQGRLQRVAIPSAQFVAERQD